MAVAGEHDPWDPRTVGIALAAYQPNPIWLAEQLNSIVAQTYAEWICIITIDSPLRDIQEHPRLWPFFQDSRFTWVENEERLGVRRNFEKAIALATEKNVDLIAFADQDDIWLPEKIAESVAAIKISGSMSVVASDSYIFSGDLILSETIYSYIPITKKSLTLEEMIIYPTLTGFTMVLDSKLTKLHPLIPEPMRHHDYWFSLVGAAYGGVMRIDKPLAFYRQHESNTTGIRAVRTAFGLPQVKVSTSASEPVRGLGRRHRGAARVAANQLPLGSIKRTLLRYHIGWMMLLLTIIVRRTFVERRLVDHAYRALVAQLLVFPSQAAQSTSIRSRIPIRGQLLPRIALAASVVGLGAAVLFTETLVDLLSVAAAPLWLIFGAAALLAPAWRIAQHRYPDGGQSLVGMSAVLAGLVRLTTSSPILSILAFVIPVAWHLAYRIRWRGDTGY
ncbi:MAG: glycosyltransferase [Candidatus Limnocylindrus sp.]